MQKQKHWNRISRAGSWFLLPHPWILLKIIEIIRFELAFRMRFLRAKWRFKYNVWRWIGRSNISQHFNHRASMQNVIYYWSEIGLWNERSRSGKIKKKMSEIGSQWQQQQRLGTSFPFASQTAVDLIHINVLLSSIPYLPIPTNLITPFLSFSPDDNGTLCAEKNQQHSRFIGYCAVNGTWLRKALLLLLQILVIVF